LAELEGNRKRWYELAHAWSLRSPRWRSWSLDRRLRRSLLPAARVATRLTCARCSLRNDAPCSRRSRRTTYTFAGILATSPPPLLFSQLDRFLRARQARSGPLFLGGATSSPKVSFEPGNASAGRSIAVDTGDAYEDGLEIYARIVGSGGELALIQVAAGALHSSSYRFRVPRRVIDLPDDARLEIALVDARGCDSCSGGAWRWRLERQDKVVDSYP
jgi:hypothetical protein